MPDVELQSITAWDLAIATLQGAAPATVQNGRPQYAHIWPPSTDLVSFVWHPGERPVTYYRGWTFALATVQS